MGLTAASLHLLRPSPGADVTSAVTGAYKRLGYSKAKDDSPATRGVVLVDRGDFVSIHDSGNGELDTDELRELAGILSKSTKSAAIVATVNDSDTFAFLLFHRGKQIDAAFSEPPSVEASVTMPAGKKRARAWFDAFQQRDFLQFVAKGNSIGFKPETQMARYAEAIAAAAATESPFAETILGAWCEAAGLPAEAPCLTFRDCAEDPSLATTRLTFVSGPPKSSTVKPDPPSRPTGLADAVQLAHTHDDDDGAHLVFHPAAWPVPPNCPSAPQWFLVSTGAGFRGLCVRVRIQAAGDLRVQSVRVVAYPFYNGQVTSMTPAAQQEFPTPHLEDANEGGRSVLRIDAPDFELPTPRPESKRQTLIILSVDLETGASGHAELAPVVWPDSVETSAVRMPSLRLVWHAPTWLPLISGASPQAQTLDAVRRLNSSSCRSQLAVLPGDDPATRATFRRLFESCLDAMRPSATIRARVRTQKHMSASFSVSKNERWMELSALRGDKTWGRLFDGDADYQSVFVDLVPNEALYPQAGLVMQASLRGSALAGLRRPSLSGGAWVLDHPEVYATFGLTADDVSARFATWVVTTTAAQAWSQSAAWIPMFDTYDAYRQTPYESAATPDWLRTRLDGGAAVGTWSGSRLRTIAPEMWLDQSMMADIDLAALDRVAERRPVGALTHIRLRADAALNDLERLFASRLPAVHNLRP